MVIATVADQLATALAATGLRTLPYLADNVQPPAILIAYPDITFDIDFGDEDVWTIPVWLFVSKVSDRAARAEASKYLARTGQYSIKAAIEADKTLAGSVDTLAVKRARPQIATVGLTELLAYEFSVEVFG